MRLWEEIRELTLKSIAPAPIYEEGNLIKRSIRDLYNREIDEVLVEGEAGYRTAKDFMKMIMPSHARDVKRYDEAMPLFARFQVESYLGGMFNPTVQLKSGGYIVIGVTEALVAIDVNSGRATKEGNIEDTALKTNLEAADEIARQLRLRDLAGLIVIDFIDMEERKNNAAVEKRLKDRLKTDRARIQVGRISGFGLMEMSRQRLRPGMLESTTQPCSHCHGTGLIRSDDSMALTILRALEEEGTRKRSREVLLKAPVGIVNFLINQKREHVTLIESRYGMSIRIEADPKLVSPDYALEKFKTATRVVPEAPRVISGNASLMGEVVEEADEDLPVDQDEAEETPATDERSNGQQGDGTGKKKRRRRRRGRGKGAGQGQTGSMTVGGTVVPEETEDDDGNGEDEGPASDETLGEATAPAAEAPAEAVAEAGPETPVQPVADKAAKTSRTSTRKPRAKADKSAAEPTSDGEEPAEAKPGPAPKKPSRAKSASPKPAASKGSRAKMTAGALEGAANASADAFPADPGDAPAEATGLTPDPGAAEAAAVPEASSEPKPRRKGWWSLGR
jgi:ribonuclease E